MRTPNLHLPRFSRPHLAEARLDPLPRATRFSLWGRPIGRLDILALVLAVTLAAAVAVAFWAQGGAG